MNIFVGCASSQDLDYKYYLVANKVANAISDDNNLVFGGYNHGIMGVFYNKFKEKNRQIVGVVNKVYEDDLNSIDCDLSIVTDTTSERTYKMFLNSDILLFMPGGIGTVAELFSALEEKRNGMDKPIIIYNEYGLNDDVLNDDVLNLINTLEKNKLYSGDGKLYDVVDSTEQLTVYINENQKVKGKKI